MKASVIILAAGLSKRLQPLTNNIPKALLKIGDKTLIEQHIILLKPHTKQICVVTGHAHERVKQLLNAQVELIYNPEYNTKNNCYSLLLGLKKIGTGAVIVVNSDVYCHPEIYESLLSAINKNPDRNYLVVDDVNPPDEEAMKVKIANGRIVRIHKSILPEEAVGEYIGISYIAEKYMKQMIEAHERIVKESPHFYYEDAFQLTLGSTEWGLVSTKGLPWTEIDDFRDLEFARQLKLN